MSREQLMDREEELIRRYNDLPADATREEHDELYELIVVVQMMLFHWPA